MAKRSAPGPSDLSYIAPDLRALARPCAELTADPRNARKHGERNLAAVRASLERFGQRKPIVVRAGVVVAGNATLHETVALGRSHVAVANADDLTADEARAYGVSDNRTAELAEWDAAELALARDELGEDALIGFTAAEIDEMLPPPEEPLREGWGDPGADAGTTPRDVVVYVGLLVRDVDAYEALLGAAMRADERPIDALMRGLRALDAEG